MAMGGGGEIKIYLDAVRDPKTVAEIEGQGEEEPVHKEGEEEPVHKNKDKGTGVVIEEGGDGEGADWVDWDRENAEWVADSENDLYDGEDGVDYSEDDECFDANIDKDAEWAGFLQDDHEDEMRSVSDDNTEDDSEDEFDGQKNRDDDNDARGPAKKPVKVIDRMSRQRGKRICKFCHEVGHFTKGCKWKKFAEKFPPDEEIGQPAESEQHVAAIVQQDELVNNDDCLPINQPEAISQPEPEVSIRIKPVKKAIFNDEDEPHAADQIPVAAGASLTEI
ncbi:hypothetical protein Salat_1059700 [Sesamum alatum]|uniref:Uncharacterized protein n=1 Tax=Sesamum alatum TaxID=300844 RepID=A0AAE1YM43_9LAMI|nr:hypothetical protein Salat_1059700 [Sesamum alatum]